VMGLLFSSSQRRTASKDVSVAHHPGAVNRADGRQSDVGWAGSPGVLRTALLPPDSTPWKVLVVSHKPEGLGGPSVRLWHPTNRNPTKPHLLVIAISRRCERIWPVCPIRVVASTRTNWPGS
jgi:hypothetical protein